MKKFIYLILSFIFFSSCSSNRDQQEKLKLFSNKEKHLIERFSYSLRDSINSCNYQYITTSWDQKSFETYFFNESRISRSILNNFLKEVIQKDIGNYLLEFVDKIKKIKGKAKLIKINHYDDYSKISFSVTYNQYVDFAIFKVKIRNNSPKITDIYSFSNSDWFSESLKKALNLNVKYDIQTTERRLVNQAISGYKTADESEDHETALMNLNLIPKSHQNDLSTILKLNSAKNLSADVYKNILDKECSNSENLCIQYLYATFYKDKKMINEISKKLEVLVGNCSEIDSLKDGSKLWDQNYINPFALLSVYKVAFVLGDDLTQ